MLRRPKPGWHTVARVWPTDRIGLTKMREASLLAQLAEPGNWSIVREEVAMEVYPHASLIVGVAARRIQRKDKWAVRDSLLFELLASAPQVDPRTQADLGVAPMKRSTQSSPLTRVVRPFWADDTTGSFARA